MTRRRVSPRTIHMEDQVRAALVDLEIGSPATVQDLCLAASWPPNIDQPVRNYLRRLESNGMAERWEVPVPGGRKPKIGYGPTSQLLIEFAIAMPPLRVREPRRVRRDQP